MNPFDCNVYLGETEYMFFFNVIIREQSLTTFIETMKVSYIKIKPRINIEQFLYNYTS